jgi:hypothetical protein
MQPQPHAGTRRWRLVLLLTLGAWLGSLLGATPVCSHVGGTVWHLWHDHMVPRADKRYVLRHEARDRYVPVAFGTTRTDVTTSFHVLSPDELHGVSVLNDSDVDQGSDMIIANDRSSGDIFVLATGGPSTLARGEGVEISSADPLAFTPSSRRKARRRLGRSACGVASTRPWRARPSRRGARPGAVHNIQRKRQPVWLAEPTPPA